MSDENRAKLARLVEGLGETLAEWDAKDFAQQYHFWGDLWELRDLIATIDREAPQYDEPTGVTA